MPSVPRFEQVGAVSVVLVGGVGSCGRLPRVSSWWRLSASSSLVALTGVVVFLLVGGGSCRCGRVRPRWRRWQLQLWLSSSLLAVAAAVILVDSVGSCRCGHDLPPRQWRWQLQPVSWSSSSLLVVAESFPIRFGT